MTDMITPERFASGMTFDDYVAHIGTPKNLAREGTAGGVRRDMSEVFRKNFEARKLNDAELEALKLLMAMPGGPAKILAISEDWSSDCRRDIPTAARIAAETGMELRIFDRDGQKFGASQLPSLEEAPDSNADLMLQFLNHKNGGTWQSIPVIVFLTKDLDYLYHFTEYPAIYEKDRIVKPMRTARPDETPEQFQVRSDREFADYQASPYWQLFVSAAVDEMISALYRRLVLGAV